MLLLRFPWLKTRISGSGWMDLVEAIYGCKTIRRSIPVWWHKPPNAVFKLNTDGSLLGTGDRGGGGVVRDAAGSMVVAFSGTYKRTSVLGAEARALLSGLEICRDRGLSLFKSRWTQRCLCNWSRAIWCLRWKYFRSLDEYGT